MTIVEILDRYDKLAEEILNLLHDISKAGRAVLMATHDYVHMKKFSSRVLRCENNTVIEKSAQEASL
jgi:cell division transport system ATP-binding protein